MSELAIAQWGAGQSDEVKKALGFEKGVTPHQTTIQRLFRKMNVEELEEAFRGLFAHLFEPTQPQRGACAVAIDGKAHKGRLKFEEEKSYPVHAVSLVEHETGIVLMQGHVQRGDTEAKERPTEEETKGEPSEQKPGKKGKPGELTEQEQQREQAEKKQRSELAVAYRLIAHIDWKGKVLTGDAFYCQRCLCAAILLAGGIICFW